jgi:hypothetical protein
MSALKTTGKQGKQKSKGQVKAKPLDDAVQSVEGVASADPKEIPVEPWPQQRAASEGLHSFNSLNWQQVAAVLEDAGQTSASDLASPGSSTGSTATHAVVQSANSAGLSSFGALSGLTGAILPVVAGAGVLLAVSGKGGGTSGSNPSETPPGSNGQGQESGPNKPIIDNIHSASFAPLLTGMANKQKAGQTVALEAGDIIKITVKDQVFTFKVNDPASNSVLSYDTNTQHWSLQLPQDLITADGSYAVLAVVTLTGGEQATFTGEHALTIDHTAPSITIDQLSGDGYLNALEKGQTWTLSGNSNAQNGQDIFITTSTEQSFTTKADAQGHWQLSITKDDMKNWSDQQITFDVQTTNIFGLRAQGSAELVIDTQAPELTMMSLKELIPSGNGSVADNTINKYEMGLIQQSGGWILKGGSSAEQNQQVTVSFNNKNYITHVIDGVWSVKIGMDDINALVNGADYPVTVSTLDKAGNPSVQIHQTVKIDAAGVPINTLMISGGATLDGVGYAVAALGDVNGDGFEDIAVTAPYADASASLTDSGKVYVVFGKSDYQNINLAQIENGLGGFVIKGSQAGDLAGMSVAAAGDINGDGWSDIAVGVPYADKTPSDNAGKTFVVYGKADGAAVSLSDVNANATGFYIYGNPVTPAIMDAYTHSGQTVKGIGDFNHDGMDDLLIGAGGTGGAFIVLGKHDSGNIDLGQVALGHGGKWIGSVQPGENLGGAIDGIGDVNGDGINDILLGSSGFDDNVSNQGISHVVFGQANLSSAQGYWIGQQVVVDAAMVTLGASHSLEWIAPKYGAGNSTYFNSISFTPDYSGIYNINSYGFSGVDPTVFLYRDNILLASDDNSNVTGGAFSLTSYLTGGVNYQIRISEAGNVKASGTVNYEIVRADIPLSDLQNGKYGFAIIGETNVDDRSGFAVAGLGDVNGDGFTDLAITATGGDPGLQVQEAGKTYIVWGSASPHDVNLSSIALGDGGFVIQGANANEQSGFSVSKAGDVNGDGLADILIGAPYADPSGNADGGTAYVVFGKVGNSTIDLSQIHQGIGGFAIDGSTVAEVSDLMGWSVSTAGDLNGDGVDDLIIGARASSSNGSSVGAGRAIVVFGGQAQFGSEVDVLGTNASETLNGTSGDDLIVAGDGHDTIYGLGGADVIYGGRGNDSIHLNSSNMAKLGQVGIVGVNTRIDGGTGINTLVIDGANLTLDLTVIKEGLLKDMQKIDLKGSGNNALKLSFSDVISLGSDNVFNESTQSGFKVVSGSIPSPSWGVQNPMKQLLITGDAGDRVTLVDGLDWKSFGEVKQGTDAETYKVYAYGTNLDQWDVLVDNVHYDVGMLLIDSRITVM